MPRKKNPETDIVDVVLKEVFAEITRQNINITVDGMMAMAGAVKKRIAETKSQGAKDE